jgi:ATP-dependent DNA helicase RecG
MTSTEVGHLLGSLLALSTETEWVEFKENNFNPQEIGEYLSALSNSACLHSKSHGYLVFGIEDTNHKVVGVKSSLKTEKIGNQELENWLATQLEPRIDFNFVEFMYDNKLVALFRIEPALTRPTAFRGSKFIRVGSYKKKLSDHPEKERKIWLMTNKIKFENELALENVEAEKALSLLDYPKYFDLMKQNLPNHKDAILSRLIEEHLIATEGTKFHITNLGAILFAKNLDNFGRLFRKAVRVIIYKDKGRLNAVREHIEKRGYACGLEDLVNYINDQLPSNEEIGRVFRREMKMYPEMAIRELVANAVIHQDFFEIGTGPMVEIFSDRIEITNQGKPLISTLRFIDHNPKSRNEKLAHFMRRMNICEERGTGIDKVIMAIEASQLPAPKFQGENTFLRAFIYGPRLLKDMDKEDRIRACYQHSCLKYVSNEMMTNQSLRARFKIEEKNYPMASRIIRDTIDAGLIRVYDQSVGTKGIKYVPSWA